MKKTVLLCIMDGFGINDSEYGNAIKFANTPNLDKFFAECPNTLIGASGLDVGLPDGQMGNSEVGHTNIGAGRVVYQELTRITKSIADGDFFENEVLVAAMENCKKNDSALHLMGLVSDGGVHSHNTHLYAIIEMAKRMGLDKVFVHCFMDGRDVPPTSGKDYIAELYSEMEKIGLGKIATIEGRYYAMDRDNRWERVVRAYNAMTKFEGNKFSCGVEMMQKSYDDGITDEFIVPSVSEDAQAISDNDSVVFFNFRPDRAREITRAFVDGDFNGFEREQIKGLYFVCMTQYDATMPNVDVAFKPQSLDNTFGEYLSNKGMTQLRIAETEKYAHVTFFFNGGVEKQYEGEDRVLINSPKVATYDLQPEMSAFEVTDAVVEKYDVIILNYANCDMVGHTGIFDATVKAVETVDTCVGRVADAIKKIDGVMLITADHGNADKMYEDDGSPFTAHTTNLVPLIIVNKDCKLNEGGKLCDLCPTILDIMNLEQPPEMTGRSLIAK
jgi:2,3-bisphosphoglycerate-independent phosphoglycerate mutase